MSMSRNHVQNIDNYNITFQDNYSTIFTRYMLIINEYLKHYLDNIYIQNPTYYKYVLNRGIGTIDNIFKMLLIYTKNLDMVFYNCQKAYIYYIEFIGQIGDDNHTFLQLNSKDASLFVYKKTIFEINNDAKKNYIPDELSNKLIYNIDTLIKIYNTIIFRLIECNTIINVIKIVNTDLQNTMQKIIKLCLDINDTSKLKAILTFSIYCKKDNIIDYIDIFIKKIKKKSSINIIKLEQYLLDDCNNSITLLPLKYINLLLSHI